MRFRVGRARYRADREGQRTPRGCRLGIVSGSVGARYRAERAPRRPLDAAGRARCQLDAAPTVRQMPRAAQSMPRVRSPLAARVSRSLTPAARFMPRAAHLITLAARSTTRGIRMMPRPRSAKYSARSTPCRARGFRWALNAARSQLLSARSPLDAARRCRAASSLLCFGTIHLYCTTLE